METQAIAVQGQQAAVVWTEARVELVKRSICPKGIGNDEFALFMEQCKRSGLDPLLKEAFCVPRKAKLPDGSYGTRHEFQPSEAGMLARAEKFPDYEGISASAVYAEDEIVVDQGEGRVVHRFNPAKRKGSLVGAWARVQRRGKVAVVVWLDFGGYVQQSPLWSKIPTTMIEKCARVAALRKAYPEAFGGLYIREEMPEAEFVEAQPVAAAPSPRVRRQERATEEAQVVDAPQLPATGSLEAPRETVAKAAKVAEVKERVEKVLGRAPGIVTFGQHKGRSIPELGDKDLADTIDLGDAKLAESPDAPWYDAVKANLDLLLAEHALRQKVPAREVGSEG